MEGETLDRIADTLDRIEQSLTDIRKAVSPQFFDGFVSLTEPDEYPKPFEIEVSP